MAAKSQIYKDAKGQFGFRLLASNGQVTATGQGSASTKSRLAGVDSVKKNAPAADVEEVES